MKRWGLLVSIVACAMAGAACGDDGASKGHLADAPPVDDAAIDAIAAVQPVTVTVTVQGAAQKDVPVYFQNADSTIVLATTTADDGTAQTVMAAGGFVTVLDPVSNNGSGSDDHQVTTFAGVKPGDSLRDDLRPLFTQTATKTVTVSVTNEQAGHEYFLWTTCGGNAGSLGIGEVIIAKARPAIAVATPVTASVSLFNCGDTADMLVVATSIQGESRVVTGWQYKAAVAVADGTDVTFDGAYQAPLATTINYSKVSDSQSSLTVERSLYTANGPLFTSDQQFANVDGTTATVSVALPSPAGVPVLTSTFGQAANNSRHTFYEWGANVATYDLAYADNTLSAFASQAVIDADAHAITWTDDAGAPADFALASYFVRRTEPETRGWTWRIAGPYVSGKLVLPVLPTTVFDYNPKTGDAPSLNRLSLVKLPGGYDTARARIFDTDIPTSGGGASGKVVVEDYVPRPLLAGPNRRAAPKRLSPASR